MHSSPISRKHWTTILFCLLALTSTCPIPANGQSSGIRKILESQLKPAESPSPAEKPDETEARLQQWLKEAREALTRLEDPSAEAQLPTGISTADLEDRRRNTEQTILAISRHLKSIASAKDAKQALEGARARDSEWNGFKDQAPPYSILMIDELRNEQDAVSEKLSASESSLLLYQRSLANVQAELKTAEDATRDALLAVDKASDNKDAAKWRLDAARVKSRMLATRAASIQINCSSLDDLAAAEKSEFSLLARQIKIAQANSSFTDEDLAKINKIAADRKASIQQDIESVQKRLKTATAERKAAQSALDALQPASPDDKSAPPKDGIELARIRLEAADGRVESLQFIRETLDGLTQSAILNTNAYQDRKSVINAASPAGREKALQSLGTLLDRLHAWEIVVANDISGVGADISKLDSRLSSVTAQDPRFALLGNLRAAKAEKQAILQRLSQNITNQRKLLTRWIDDFTPKDQGKPFAQRFTEFRQAAWGVIQKIWTFEVFSIDDTINVEGLATPVTRSVTLGLLLRAVLFFTIGYLILSKFARKIQHTIVARGHIAHAQARTLRKWLMVIVNVFLALATLQILNIPLTIFAYFGGALAIGLGFGTQTLIKNFISGIIVLFERKVRVGDIVDVDGIVGTVSEINTRSSVVRGFDGVETMIPNSLFLENRVTNWTLSNTRARRSIRITAAYGTHPQDVMEIILECIDRHGLILNEPNPYVILEDFGDSALVFSAYYWLELNDKTNANIVASDLRLMIDKRFQEAGISIPFPQRDIRITTPIQIAREEP